MPSALLGHMIGNIRLDSCLADDARVIVYRGHHTTLGIDVALKILNPACYQAQASFYYDLFRREAQIAAKLDDHPNIVRVLDFGQHETLPYLVMELIDGFPLPEYIRRHRGPLSESKTLKIVMATATALEAVYKTGICPCELKPSNLYITRTGQLKIAAIRPSGFARIPSADGPAPVQGAESTRMIMATDTMEMPSSSGNMTLSVDRVTVGAVAYMAPEHFRPDATIDQRSDLYTLGVLGYRAAFGHLPYIGDALKIINGHLRGDASFTESTACGEETLRLIKTMIRSDPGERYDSVVSLMRDARLVLKTLGRQADSDSGSPVNSDPRHEVTPLPAPQQVPPRDALMEIAQSMEMRLENVAAGPPQGATSSSQPGQRLANNRRTS